MKLRLHHIEICVKDPSPIVNLFRNQFGLNLVGQRETKDCLQFVLKLAKTVLIITSRKISDISLRPERNNNFETLNRNHIYDKQEKSGKLPKDKNDYWTLFCCPEDQGERHIDSVFNVSIEVKDLFAAVESIKKNKSAHLINDICRVDDGKNGYVDFAIVKSCCGNVVHTLIQKDNFQGWFLPGFNRLTENNNGSTTSSSSSGDWNCYQQNNDDNMALNEGEDDVSHIDGITMSHFDHFTLACRVGETDEIIRWYERVFGMKRFITNRQDTEEDGLVIEDDVGLRLKVMEFWRCSESGVASHQYCKDDGFDIDEEWEPLKIVIAESLPGISNTQIESFVKDHHGPGIQHIGFHTENMVGTVRQLCKNGAKFRHPPPTYYTEVGQLGMINAVGEDLEELRKYGILLDNEADLFDEDISPLQRDRYLMQVFTFPIFDKDTFFLEVIQRKGARGFGVGNVTALARSVNAYKEMLLKNSEAIKAGQTKDADDI